jgi:hypothetical protein
MSNKNIMRKNNENNIFDNSSNLDEYPYGKPLRRCPSSLKNPNDIIISKELNQNCRIFYAFEDYEQFEKFYTKETDFKERHLYEVIFSAHRFYIDVDVDLKKYDNIDEQELLDEVIRSVLIVFKDIQIDKDIFIYSSHGPSKKSFHIVVHRAINNMQISGEIIKLIKRNVKEDLRNFIDENVYKSKQQLRILYSSKYSDPTRIKIFEGQWKFQDQWIKNPVKKQDILKYSLVTLLLDSENVSGRFADLVLYKSNNNNGIARKKEHSGPIKSKSIIEKKAYEKTLEDLEYFFEKEMKTNKLIPIEVKPYQDNFLLILRNNGGYMCKIHKRVHEKENPYVYFTLDSSYFYCRRSENNDEYYGFCMRYKGEKTGEPVRGVKSRYYNKILEMIEKDANKEK